ncbi:hypothetical protein SGPA1_11988 [Streptomyces misionensis JCM 4497]
MDEPNILPLPRGRKEPSRTSSFRVVPPVTGGLSLPAAKEPAHVDDPRPARRGPSLPRRAPQGHGRAVGAVRHHARPRHPLGRGRLRRLPRRPAPAEREAADPAGGDAAGAARRGLRVDRTARADRGRIRRDRRGVRAAPAGRRGRGAGAPAAQAGAVRRLPLHRLQDHPLRRARPADRQQRGRGDR